MAAPLSWRQADEARPRKRRQPLSDAETLGASEPAGNQWSGGFMVSVRKFVGQPAMLGLTLLFQAFPSLLTALRYAGTFYLFYLAYDAWQDSTKPPQVAARSHSAFLVQGFVSNALNPKAYLFYAAILPQFLTTANQTREIALLTAIYVVVATSIHFFIALAAGSLADWLAHAPQAQTLRRAMALAIAAAAIWFFISTGHMT